jgi:hypothetical protein
MESSNFIQFQYENENKNMILGRLSATLDLIRQRHKGLSRKDKEMIIESFMKEGVPKYSLLLFLNFSRYFYHVLRENEINNQINIEHAIEKTKMIFTDVEDAKKLKT